MSGVFKVLKNMERDFPRDVKLLVAQVLSENKNLIAGVAPDKREAAAMGQIRDAIGNILRSDRGVRDTLGEESLGEDSPRAIISMELSEMSKRVSLGHSAKIAKAVTSERKR